VVGGRLVVHDPARPRVAQLLGQRIRRILVDAAKGVVAPVRAFHGEPLRLEAADPEERGQAAGERPKVQDVGLDARRPERTVVRAPEPAVEAAGLVLRPDHDGVRVGRRSDGVVLSAKGNREEESDDGGPEDIVDARAVPPHE
jgi:hypothetical protein